MTAPTVCVCDFLMLVWCWARASPSFSDSWWSMLEGPLPKPASPSLPIASWLPNMRQYVDKKMTFKRYLGWSNTPVCFSVWQSRAALSWSESRSPHLLHRPYVWPKVNGLTVFTTKQPILNPEGSLGRGNGSCKEKMKRPLMLGGKNPSHTKTAASSQWTRYRAGKRGCRGP